MLLLSFVQVYERLNQVNVCVSYPATLAHMDEVARLYTVPIKQWIAQDDVFKFFGDNVNKKQKRRDERSDNSPEMLNMFSIIVSKSRTPAPSLLHTGQVRRLSELPTTVFLPSHNDVENIKSNLVVIVSRVLTKYITSLAPFAKSIEQHIPHMYTKEMVKKSEIAVMDILMKDETKHSDMIAIMETMQGYLGTDYNEERRVLSGGDLLTCERQKGSQKHMMCGDTMRERLEVLEPVNEDWHCLLCLLEVSIIIKIVACIIIMQKYRFARCNDYYASNTYR